MPTANVRPSMVRLFRVISRPDIAVNVATIEMGTASGRNGSASQIPHEEKDDNGRQEAANDQMFIDGVDRSFNEARLIAHNFRMNIGRKLGTQFLQPLPNRFG